MSLGLSELRNIFFYQNEKVHQKFGITFFINHQLELGQSLILHAKNFHFKNTIHSQNKLLICVGQTSNSCCIKSKNPVMEPHRNMLSSRLQ